MSGECNKCSEHTLDCHCKGDISTKLVDAIIRLGRAQERLKDILDDELFKHLSKHYHKWESNHDRENDILDDTRRALSCLSDNLWDLYTILRPEIDS